MRRGRGKYKAYYSKTTQRVLLVYKIDNGVRGNVSRLWRDEWDYTAENYDLTGFYLFVLYNAGGNDIFHAELRYGNYAGINLEYMRYKNHLAHRLFPIPIIEQYKYYGPNPINKINDGGVHLFKG
ncbi:hypothetical protein HZI73_15640 [Vallitalea pronyensis]|uniref:Uncharacterized protein n=1 Tax=Vallitalea pronyensis TaxID=1348613 RepID=A0A8J8MLU4_9FIRM|nr:hypothetical protein [Vallitalea pronyensis]QUI23633.1 hypothetical protein HZI73_15640 [Vallitalea pronyensis]